MRLYHQLLLLFTVVILTLHEEVFCSKKMKIIEILDNRETYDKLYDSVLDGAFIGLEQCKQQFRYSKWNCSIALAKERKQRLKDITMSSILHDTRETAFTHSITSAGATYVLTRDCRHGKFQDCTCINNKIKAKDNNWWGGCSENIKFGEVMAKHFLEAIEIKDAPSERLKLISHNNDVGRKAVRANLRKQCRCHGITGTCSTKTCWRRLPSFNEIGKYLHEKYKDAKKVRYLKRLFKSKGPKGLRSILRKEQTLIYTDSSPDYCQRNASVAADGVLGRECQGSDKNLEKCRKICNSCGLKAVDYKEIQKYNCHCKFQWCCKVKCESCNKSVCKTKCVMSNSTKTKL